MFDRFGDAKGRMLGFVGPWCDVSSSMCKVFKSPFCWELIITLCGQFCWLYIPLTCHLLHIPVLGGPPPHKGRYHLCWGYMVIWLENTHLLCSQELNGFRSCRLQKARWRACLWSPPPPVTCHAMPVASAEHSPLIADVERGKDLFWEKGSGLVLLGEESWKTLVN